MPSLKFSDLRKLDAAPVLAFFSQPLRRRTERILLCFSLAVVAFSAAWTAFRRPFWVDEYLSLITESSGSPASIWRMLKVEPLSVDPPLYHFGVSGILAIVGTGEFQARLLSIAAYVAAALLFYLFVRRYSDVYTGLFSVGLFLSLGSFRYSYEARPYSLVLAASAAALYGWACIDDGVRKRRIGLCTVWISVAIAIGSHWYGGLILFPLALGQIVRDIRRQKVDRPVWAAMLTAAATILLYRPLLPAAQQYKAMPWKGVTFSDIGDTFGFIVEPALTGIIFSITAVILLYCFDARKRASPPLAVETRWPSAVLACVAGFAILPIPGYLVAKVITHSLVSRYLMPSTIGLVAIACFLLANVLASRPWASLVAVATLWTFGAWPALRMSREIPTLWAHRTDRYALDDPIPTVPASDAPIVVSDLNLFMRIEEHESASLARNCVYVADEESTRILGADTTFRLAHALQRWTRLPVINLQELKRNYPSFYLIGDPRGVGSWMFGEVLGSPAAFRVEESYSGGTILKVHPVAAGASQH